MRYNYVWYQENIPMSESPLTVYLTDWCSDCRRTLRWLDRHAVPYTTVDIESDPNADELVRRLNRGCRSVPTLVFPDGDVLVEPSSADLKQKLGL